MANRMYLYQDTQTIGDIEKEIWNDGDPNHEALTMYSDGDGYWWAYEKDTGSGIRLTDNEHNLAREQGFPIPEGHNCRR